MLARIGLKYLGGQFGGEVGMISPQPSQGELAEWSAVTQQAGLAFASVNADGDFMVKHDIDAEIALACKQIDLAATLKPAVIIVFAGWQDREDPAVYEQVSAALKQVARHAGRYGLTVAMENHGGLTRTAEQCDRILAGVGEPNIGLNYDPANFAMYGVDPLEALRQLDSPVVFTHLKSLKQTPDGKVYCRLGEGQIDYRPILRELIARGYEGFWGLEYEEPADVFDGTQDDLATLQGWLKTIEE
jgi:sugar phosphate isomerase/epimerase